MLWASALAVAVGIAAVLAAPTARAGVSLYQASWIAQVRGNDLTAGTSSESQQFQVRALPLGTLPCTSSTQASHTL